MDDMRSFEARLAEELGLMAGPEPPVDALAVSRSVAAQAPKRRLQTMFSATKLVLASAIVALFGGLLMAGLLITQDGEPQAPAAETTPAAQVSGEVDADAMPRPAVDVRLVVRLVDAAAADDETAHLGEFVRYGVDQAEGPYPFTIDYAPSEIDPAREYVLETRIEESATGRLIYVGVPRSATDGAVPVITQGNPVEGIDIILVEAPADGMSAWVSGVLLADPGVPNPDAGVRMVVTLSESTAAATGADPVAQEVMEGFSRIRPPRNFALEYGLDSIDEAAGYVLEARLEDAASGTLLAATGDPVAIITDGAPVENVTLKLVAIE
jgi:uncharacterized lipoprotein YbaY